MVWGMSNLLSIVKTGLKVYLGDPVEGIMSSSLSMVPGTPSTHGPISYMGVSLNGGTPISHTKNDHF